MAKFHFYLRWEKPVCLLKPESGGSDSLAEFIRARKGKNTAVICRGRPNELAALKQDLLRSGLDPGELQPEKKEAVEDKPWTVFILNIPESLTPGTEKTVSPVSEKTQK